MPLPGCQVVRRYGLYANGKREALDRARSLFGQEPVAAGEYLDWQRYIGEFVGQPERTRCSRCGAPLRRITRVATGPDPPGVH